MNDKRRNVWINMPLEKDKKGRYYLPRKLFCDFINKDEILVNTPSIGVCTYKVHTNKDGSRWIKGDSISKYWLGLGNATTRLFLDEEVIKRIDEHES